MAKYAESLGDYVMESHEVQWAPGGVTSYAFTQGTATRGREYSIAELRPPGSAGSEDPFGTTGGASPLTASLPGGATVAISFVGPLIAAVAALS